MIDHDQDEAPGVRVVRVRVVRGRVRVVRVRPHTERGMQTPPGQGPRVRRVRSRGARGSWASRPSREREEGRLQGGRAGGRRKGQGAGGKGSWEGAGGRGSWEGAGVQLCRVRAMPAAPVMLPAP